MKLMTYFFIGFGGGLIGMLPFIISRGDFVECVAGFIFAAPLMVITVDFVRGYRKARSLYHSVLAYFI